MSFRDLESAIESVTELVNMIIPLFIGIALLFFIWNLIKYVLRASDEEERTASRSYMIYSIIAFFVMISIWGLVNFLVATFGLEGTQGPVQLPAVPTTNPAI
jgi:hypothetical protein